MVVNEEPQLATHALSAAPLTINIHPYDDSAGCSAMISAACHCYLEHQHTPFHCRRSRCRQFWVVLPTNDHYSNTCCSCLVGQTSTMGRPLEFGESFGDWRKKKSKLTCSTPRSIVIHSIDRTGAGLYRTLPVAVASVGKPQTPRCLAWLAEDGGGETRGREVIEVETSWRM